MKHLKVLGAVIGICGTTLAGIGEAIADPDLEISTVFVNAPRVAQPGDTVFVDVTVFNRLDVAAGTDTAGRDGYMIDLVLSTDEAVPAHPTRFEEAFREDVLLRNGRLSRTPDLGQNGARTWSGVGLQIPADTPAGDLWVCAIADSIKRIREVSEDNNVACTPVQIILEPLLPDFVMELLDPEIACVEGFQELRIRYRMRNLGQAEAPLVNGETGTVTFLVNGADRWEGGGPNVSASIQPIQVGGGRTGAQPVPALFRGQSILVGFEVDPLNLIDELNEQNNRVEMKVNVPEVKCN